MLVYKILLPDATAPDVVSWDLAATVNGGPEAISTVTDEQEFEFNDNDVVTWRVRQVDDATPPNVSDWGPEFAFTAADTIAPPEPGAPGAELVREQ